MLSYLLLYPFSPSKHTIKPLFHPQTCSPKQTPPKMFCDNCRSTQLTSAGNGYIRCASCGFETRSMIGQRQNLDYMESHPHPLRSNPFGLGDFAALRTQQWVSRLDPRWDQFGKFAGGRRWWWWNGKGDGEVMVSWWGGIEGGDRVVTGKVWVKVVVPGFIQIEIEIEEWDGLSIPVLPIPNTLRQEESKI